MRIYRALLHLYPRSFRHEYGDDMLLLLRQQLRDENVARVAARTAVDLAITVPARHLEAHMNRSSATTIIVVVFVAVGTALAVVGSPAGLLTGAALFGLALVTWRRSRPVAIAADGRWWKLLLVGVALLGGVVVVTTLTGELSSGGWYLAMATGLTSFGLIGTGLVLGIAGRVGTRAA